MKPAWISAIGLALCLSLLLVRAVLPGPAVARAIRIPERAVPGEPFGGVLRRVLPGAEASYYGYGSFFLVVRGDAGARALIGEDPRSGCPLVWQRLAREFRDPCLGTRYSLDGRSLSGPGYRPLRPLAVEAGEGYWSVRLDPAAAGA